MNREIAEVSEYRGAYRRGAPRQSQYGKMQAGSPAELISVFENGPLPETRIHEQRMSHE